MVAVLLVISFVSVFLIWTNLSSYFYYKSLKNNSYETVQRLVDFVAILFIVSIVIIGWSSLGV